MQRVVVVGGDVLVSRRLEDTVSQRQRVTRVKQREENDEFP